MPFVRFSDRIENKVICGLLKTKYIWKVFTFLTFINKRLKMLRMKYQYVSIKLTIYGHLFFLVKHKLYSGLEKAWRLSALFILIFARFEFDLAI